MPNYKTALQTDLSDETTDVPDRVANSYRKTGPLHMKLIQWHLKNNWRVPESLEKAIPISRLLHPHLKKKMFKVNHYTPSSITPKSLQMHQKKGGGSSKGNLVPSRKSVAYKLPGTKGGFLDPMRVLCKVHICADV